MPNKPIVKILIPPLKDHYSYLYPQNCPKDQKLQVGDCLSVSFGHRRAQGYVIGFEDLTDPKFKLKEINLEQSTYPAFTKEQLEFFDWIAKYYSVPLSAVIDLAVPAFAPAKQDQNISLNNLLPSIKGPQQQKIIAYLKTCENQQSQLADLTKVFPKSSATIKNLAQKNIISINKSDKIYEFKNKLTAPDWAVKDLALNPEQVTALNKISPALEKDCFTPFLLYGVTGSGKTEVYLEAIKKATAQGKSVIVIVPEISLTPQLSDRFAARLNQPLAILHSALSKGDRWNYWKLLLEGKIKIVIGARSAIFAPVQNLGLIIVDEEHDASYKQSDGIRYHGRDLAVVRAKLNSCPVILGSATPTLESIYNAHQKKYVFLKLLSRHAATTNNTTAIINLNKIKNKDMASTNVSKELQTKIAEALSRQEQVFILYNRRGFASYLQCTEGHALKCRDCSLTLTYYQTKKILVCHHCGYQTGWPSTCPDCQKESISNIDSQSKHEFTARGSGTEKVYEEIQKLFPTARVARLDRDAVTELDTYRKVLSAVRNHEVDILVGTQMIAKGHDLPNVTLVGVIDSDIGLYFPDFRAAERTYQLLTQVAGRAGRAQKPGEVIFQTRAPEHPSLSAAAKSDYLGFINYELNQRKQLKYPPFAKILRVVISCSIESKTKETAQIFNEWLQKLIAQQKLDIAILGPADAPFYKLRNRYRKHLLLKSTQAGALQTIVHFSQEKFKLPKSIHLTFDLDPQDLM